MGKKMIVEICLISARGLGRSSSLWKFQWFAVGWIDPNDKFCTKIDAPGNANPVWKTMFSVPVDASESELQDLLLNIEVRCREPCFLRESLHGTATVAVKEFVGKNGEQVESFQLRKGSSLKYRGFVDVSIRVSEEGEELSSPTKGNEEGIELLGPDGTINLSAECSEAQSYPPRPSFLPWQQENNPGISSPYARPPSTGAYYSNMADVPSSSTNYYQGQTPPAPPPPSNNGYMPTFLPRPGHFSDLSASIPVSRAAPTRNGIF